jgi:hypothetical protein
MLCFEEGRMGGGNMKLTDKYLLFIAIAIVIVISCLSIIVAIDKEIIETLHIMNKTNREQNYTIC